MGRLEFESGFQKKWLQKLIRNKNLKISDLSKLCKVSNRTIRDWLREKFKISLEAANLISNKYEVKIPPDTKILDEYWYGKKGAHKGGLARLMKYGPPGTSAGRRKGGQVSQLRRKLNPEKYLNCNIAKKFKKFNKSIDLAELAGIIFGDGGLANNQLTISLNPSTEPEYVNFVINLENKIIGERPCIYTYRQKDIKEARLVITGVNLIRNLKKIGVSWKNKVKEQVDVPKWIKRENKFSIACVRGLIDTDGCVYYHKHGKYFNIGITYTSHSVPLLKFLSQTLTNNGFCPKISGDGVYLYKESEVLKYAREIKFSNDHHLNRLNEYLKIKGRSIEAVQRVRLESE